MPTSWPSVSTPSPPPLSFGTRAPAACRYLAHGVVGHRRDGPRPEVVPEMSLLPSTASPLSPPLPSTALSAAFPACLRCPPLPSPFHPAALRPPHVAPLPSAVLFHCPPLPSPLRAPRPSLLHSAALPISPCWPPRFSASGPPGRSEGRMIRGRGVFGLWGRRALGPPEKHRSPSTRRGHLSSRSPTPLAAARR